jgi:LacI family transcriptional regulator
MLWLAEPEHERRTSRQILHSGLIDGVVISSVQKDDPLVDAMLERNFPFVMVGRPFVEKPLHRVDVNNLNGAFRAVSHLIKLGCERVATITGPSNMIAGSDRLKGYQMALEKASKVYDPALVEEGGFTHESGYECARRLLPRRPDALFCASDAMAQGAYRAILEAGLRIPQDIAVAAFDDMPFAAHMQPPLTTVRQPIQQLGMAAVDTLIHVITGPAPSQPYNVMLPTELVIRGSCGGSS